MKKVAVVSITVAVLIIVVFILNRELPPATASVPASSLAASSAPDQNTSISVNDLVLKGLDGQDVKLSDLRGKVVLIDFWGTWCEPCKIETPWLIEFQKKYASRGFTVLGVATDEGGKPVVEPYVQKTTFDVNGEKDAINYPIFLGSDDLTDKFGVTGYPTGVLIGRDGHLVKIIAGLESKDVLAKEIEAQF